MTQSKPISYLTLVSLWFGHFYVDFMLGIWAVYKTIAELDLAVCGLMVAICAFIGEGLQAYFGYLSDRGYRSYLIMLGVLLSASSAFLSYTDNYFILFILLLMTLIGSGAFHPCAASLITSLSTKRQGLLMSIFQSGGGTGLAISQIIFYYVFYQFEGHTFVLAIPTLIFVGLLACNKWILPNTENPAPKNKGTIRDYIDLLKHRELRLLYVSQVCNSALVWGILFLLPDVLVSRGFDPWICFGGGHLAFVTGMTLFLAPIGYLADKYSLKTIVMLAMGLGFFALYTFLLTPFISTPLLLVLLLVLGGCLGSVSPLNIVYGNYLVPNRAGIVSALLMGLVWCISEGIGQLGGGLLTKLFVDDAPARALGCLGILFLIGYVAYVQLPAKKEAEPEAKEPLNTLLD